MVESVKAIDPALFLWAEEFDKIWRVDAILKGVWRNGSQGCIKLVASGRTRVSALRPGKVFGAIIPRAMLG